MIRTIGFWLASLMAVLQATNAIRAFADPSGFSAYMGLPLNTVADSGFVMVYGLRTAFIACLITLLLAMRRLDVLAWMALVAVMMPVGDAVLAAQAGAPFPTLLRHGLIGVYLIVAFAFLRQAKDRVA